ncbi:hypothetical protein FB446DRAFT_709256 [Lentinula raphanica]|nr:hypothetical protein FB446DRAFT_709256 [Lentinula raphanica]
MPRVREDPPPPPYEAPAPVPVPVPGVGAAPNLATDAAPGVLPDTNPNDQNSKHDIDRRVTDLVRKHWFDDYETKYNESPSEAAKWRAQKSEEILILLERKEGFFAGTNGARGNRRKANLDALRQCFRNMAGAILKKQAKQVAIPPTVPPAIPPAVPPAVPPILSKSAAQIIVDGMFKLAGPVAGRALYEREHKDDIKASAKVGNTGNAAGNYQQALKQSWLQLDEEERRAWRERAQEEACDIDRNQELLLSMVHFIFMSMAKTGRLGDLEFVTLLSMRTTKGTLRTETVVGGTSGKDFKDSVNDWDERYVDPFHEWVERVLPQSDAATTVIRRDEAGYPVFAADIKTLETPPKHLQSLVKTFLELLYKAGKQYGEQIPWDELHQKPEDFYDVTKFNFPVPLKDPSAMGISIFPLVDALKELESPFRFRRYVTPRSSLGEPIDAGGDHAPPLDPTPSAVEPPNALASAPLASQLSASSAPPAPAPVGPVAPAFPAPSPVQLSVYPAPPSPTSVAPVSTPSPPPAPVAPASAAPLIPVPSAAQSSLALPPPAPVAPASAAPLIPVPSAAQSSLAPPPPAPVVASSSPAPLNPVPSANPMPASPADLSPAPLEVQPTTPSVPLPAPAAIPGKAKSVKKGAASKQATGQAGGRGNKRKQVDHMGAGVPAPPLAGPPLAPAPSPRKTRSARRKEGSASNADAGQGSGGEKRKHVDAGEMEQPSGRKKSKYWHYVVEGIPGAVLSDGETANEHAS